MSIYTFSTQTKKPEDDELIKRIKKLCEQRRISFSGVVLNQLAKWEQENDKRG